jgi:succinate dehydrogenase flavin-adding protein (antitoxin of CptAB toxin-antitoxin module)
MRDNHEGVVRIVAQSPFTYISPKGGLGMAIKDKYEVIVGRRGLEELKNIIFARGNKQLENIDENQRHVNRLLGIGDEVFLRYSQDSKSDDPATREKTETALNVFRNAGDLVFSSFRNNPEKWPDIIDECQRKVNKLMGISDEDFLAYKCKDEALETSSGKELQHKVNELMGITDEDVLACQCKNELRKHASEEEVQKKVNEMMGIDDDTFKRYNR